MVVGALDAPGDGHGHVPGVVQQLLRGHEDRALVRGGDRADGPAREPAPYRAGAATRGHRAVGRDAPGHAPAELAHGPLARGPHVHEQGRSADVAPPLLRLRAAQGGLPADPRRAEPHDAGGHHERPAGAGGAGRRGGADDKDEDEQQAAAAGGGQWARPRADGRAPPGSSDDGRGPRGGRADPRLLLLRPRGPGGTHGGLGALPGP